MNRKTLNPTSIEGFWGSLQPCCCVMMSLSKILCLGWATTRTICNLVELSYTYSIVNNDLLSLSRLVLFVFLYKCVLVTPPKGPTTDQKRSKKGQKIRL